MDHHYLLRIFRHRRNSEDETSSSVDTEDSKQRPKLERRNANKNIDYDPFASPSSSVPSSDGVGVPSSLRTRSLDINPFEKNTSFRIEGVDGEIDRLCETLGLSGPEDFTIPAAAWEARKARSASDIFPRSRFSKDECVTNQKNEDEGLEEATVRVTDEAEAEALLGLSTSTLDDSQDFRNSPDVGTSPPSNYGVCGGGATGSGRGIKGVRPPLLTPPPLKGRYVDNMSTASTWDIMMSLAPERGSSSCPVRLSESGSSDKDDEVGVSGEGEVLNEGETGGEKDEHENEARLGETAITSDSTTFLTSNDEDSSSATTETTYSISPEGTFRRNITSWQRGDIVGRGSFGTVFEAFTEDGFFFAVKEISLLDQSQQSVQQLEQEIALLKEFEHENIVQYLGTDRQEGKLYIFLELVKGSLVDVYRKYHLGDSQVSAYTRQILNGLKYLHDQNVVHRDIKCANILVHTSGSVKLADFGLAKAIKLNDLKSCKGTAFWMAPEVINRKMHGYGIAADIWSLGCTVLEMLTRVPPYSPLEPMQAVFRIGQGILPTIPDDLSRDARDFISQCLQVNPENRPSAVQLLNNPFVQPPLPGSLVSGSPSHHNSGRS